MIGNRKNQVFQNFIKQQKFHYFFSYEITHLFNFCPPNDGVVVIFSVLLLRPSKTSEVLKKGPNFGFLKLSKVCLKIGIEPDLYGKGVLYLQGNLLPCRPCLDSSTLNAMCQKFDKIKNALISVLPNRVVGRVAFNNYLDIILPFFDPLSSTPPTPAPFGKNLLP